MFDPTAHKDTYDPERQASANSGFELPDPGEYDVVINRVQPMIVGKNRTRKRRFRALILGAPEDLAGNVGRSFPFDLWWDLTKDANARRLGHLCAACGATKPFDPEDLLELARHTTGTPIRMKIEIEEREFNGKIRQDVRVLWVQHLPKTRREKYANAPDFGKKVGPLEDRILEERDFSQPRDGGRSSSAPRNEPAEDAGEDPFAVPF